jgi:hypothetical protein
VQPVQGQANFVLPSNEPKPIPILDFENVKSRYNLNNNYQHKENNYEQENLVYQQMLLDIKKNRNENRLKMPQPKSEF